MKTKNHNKLTKKEIHFLKSLKSTHGRKKNRVFILEGIKNVEELLLSDIRIKILYMSHTLDQNKTDYFMKMCSEKGFEFRLLSNYEYQKITTMQNPEGVLAICDYPDEKGIDNIQLPAIYLSEVNDPGNLGTIFRTAAWFGIPTVMLSASSVDAYNPKVLRGSMGSFIHLNIIQNIDEVIFSDFIDKNHIPLYIADLKGKNPVDFRPPKEFIVYFGSESHGVTDAILDHSKDIFSIPKYGIGESLNLGISVGIMLHSLINKGEK